MRTVVFHRTSALLRVLITAIAVAAIAVTWFVVIGADDLGRALAALGEGRVDPALIIAFVAVVLFPSIVPALSRLRVALEVDSDGARWGKGLELEWVDVLTVERDAKGRIVFRGADRFVRAEFRVVPRADAHRVVGEIGAVVVLREIDDDHEGAVVYQVEG